VRLSILIATMPRRAAKLAEMLARLEPQAAHKPVEVLVLRDNRRRSVGSKRNALLQIARGDYVSFVDDDDEVHPDYVEAILEATESEPDLITFPVWVSGMELYGAHARVTRFDSSIVRDSESADEYLRLPNHLCVWRREIANAFPFDDVMVGEDGLRAIRMRDAVERVVDIPQLLYWYKFDPQDSTVVEQCRPSPRRLARQLARKTRTRRGDRL